MSKVVTTMYDLVRFQNVHCEAGCSTCPLSSSNNGYNLYCSIFIRKHCDLAEKIVSDWCKKHPVKTRLTEFLKLFPDATLNCNGFPVDCIEHYCGNNSDKVVCRYTDCDGCKAKYWNQEIKD